MAKTFYTERDIEDLYARGVTSLTVSDEIVVTELDHHANVDPWVEVARDRGLTVRRARMRTEDAQLDWEDLERQGAQRVKAPPMSARRWARSRPRI